MITETWAKRFLDMAALVGSWSKDPRTKVGAVAVDEHTKRILSVGYNGFPRGFPDDEETYSDRIEKYKYVVHAEQNCIYNAGSSGVCLHGSTLICTLAPCNECAKGIVQSGIKKVIVPAHSIETVKLSDIDITPSIELFRACEIDFFPIEW